MLKLAAVKLNSLCAFVAVQFLITWMIRLPGSRTDMRRATSCKGVVSSSATRPNNSRHACAG